MTQSNVTPIGSGLLLGNHVVHRDQRAWGVGRVVGISRDGLRLAVRFAGRPREELQVATRDPSLLRYRFQPGDEVKLRGADDRIVRGVVLGADRGDLDTLTVEAEDEQYELSEKNVASLPPPSRVVEALVQGAWGEARNFLLRQSTLRLDIERRCDGLGALFASRVMVKPYQVAVAHRVLTDRMPRYVLADEVGLGKTIEAGLIISALLHARLARRVLVVAPSHLAVQWLAELRHKFNQRFTLLEPERLDLLAKEEPDSDPWHDHPLVITSLELLQRSARVRDAIADPDNRWDLVIIDEAHHLRGDRAYEAASGLSANTWGMLLLTATPMKLDPEEYFRLLKLVESAPAQSLEDFEERMARQSELTRLVRALEEATPKEAAAEARKVAALFPNDQHLAELAKACGRKVEAREALLDHVAEVYSLSARLVRNRRAVVGGFTPRRLTRIDVTLDEPAQVLHRDVQAAVREAMKAGTLVQGAPLALLLRRLDSSPAALARVLDGQKDPELKRLAPRAQALLGMQKDAKLRALRDKLRELERIEPDGKVLIFTESRETLDYLIAELSRERMNPLWYHGDLDTLERDQMVARFRDPEGPSILVSTEAGGEGRNFQFCHALIHYDLPWSPSAIEQRIGRLDRVGQTRPVDIYVLRPQGTLAARVVDLFADDVQVFTETIGGLDAVLEEVEGEIVKLAAFGGEQAWQDYARRLGDAVAKARAAIQEDYDPLLDRRSYDKERVATLLAQAHRRAGLEFDADDDGAYPLEEIEEGMQTVARDLDERLEETVLEIARKVGMNVDTDENVDAFQVRLQMAQDGMQSEALAGLDLEEDQLVEGTFWRDTAVEMEEREYLATGHPLVEALMNYVRDGDLGRASVMRLRHGGRSGVGACFSFVAQMPEPDDIAQGSHVPSRQAERLLENVLVRVGVTLEADGSVAESDGLVEALDDASRPQTLKPQDLPIKGERWEQAVRTLETRALEVAQSRLRESLVNAAERMDEELTRRLDRLALDAERGGSRERVLRAAEMVQEQQFAESVRGALRGVRLALDSACVVLLEPETPAARGRHMR